MKQLKTFLLISRLIVVVGIALCVTSISLFNVGVTLELTALCGFLGVLLSGLGLSSLVDMQQAVKKIPGKL